MNKKIIVGLAGGLIGLNSAFAFSISAEELLTGSETGKINYLANVVCDAPKKVDPGDSKCKEVASCPRGYEPKDANKPIFNATNDCKGKTVTVTVKYPDKANAATNTIDPASWKGTITFTCIVGEPCPSAADQSKVPDSGPADIDPAITFKGYVVAR